MKPTTRSASKPNSETGEITSQLAVADSSSPSIPRDEQPSAEPATSVCNSETGQAQSPSQSDVVNTPSRSRAGFKKPSTRSSTSLCNSETEHQSPSQSDTVDSPCRSSARLEKPTTRSATKQNLEAAVTSKLDIAPSPLRSRTKEEERKLRFAYGHINDIPIGFTTNKRRGLKPLHDSHCSIHMAPEGPLSIILLRNKNINDRGYIVGLLTGESQEYTGDTDAVPEGKMNINLMTALKSQLPIRILRASTLKSVFAPKTGYRYDGLYNCQACQPEIVDNKLIFKFLLQRESNQGPAPWEDHTTYNVAHTRTVVERVEIISEPQYNLASSYALRYLDFQVELDGFSLAEEDYHQINSPDTQVKLELPSVHNILEDSQDSVIALDLENTNSRKNIVDPRQSCGSVVEIFNRSGTKNGFNSAGEYASDWESDQESEILKLEPDDNCSDGETTSREEVCTLYQNDEDDLRLKEEDAPLRSHEENGISSYIEIIENPPFKEETLGNYNNVSTDDLNVNTGETIVTVDAIKSGDNYDSRDHSSEVVSFKSINSPVKSDDNFDIRSDSEEYILASENGGGENYSPTMHKCDPSCEVSGRCVIRAHNSLYGPSFVSLSPKYLNILNSVPEKNEQADVSRNINVSSVSNNSWDPDQDKKKCISGISTMSFSENGFTIDAVNESISLSDSECEVEPREWWTVTDNKSNAEMKQSNPVDSDSDVASQHLKEPPQGYCKKCAPPPYLIEDLLGDLSSVFYYFYTDFFCLCKSNSKLYTKNSDFFNKMNTVVTILNSENPKYMLGILAFLIYGRSPDLIKELELNIKNDTSKKRGRRKKKKKLVLKDEIDGSYVLFEKNNKFTLVGGEGTSYEQVINLDRVVLGTKRKFPDGEANSNKNTITSRKVNGIKKRRKVKKAVGKLTRETSWERVTRSDKVAQGTQEIEWILEEEDNLKDGCEPSPRLLPDKIQTNPMPRVIRRRRKVKNGDHKKLPVESNIPPSDDDLSPSISPLFSGFNTMEIPAAENVVEIWKESINPLLDYCPNFKGFTGVAGKKSTKKKNLFLNWMESASKTNGCVT